MIVISTLSVDNSIPLEKPLLLPSSLILLMALSQYLYLNYCKTANFTQTCKTAKPENTLMQQNCQNSKVDLEKWLVQLPISIVKYFYLQIFINEFISC